MNRLPAGGLNEMNQLWLIFFCISRCRQFHMGHMLKVCVCENVCVFRRMNDGQPLFRLSSTIRLTAVTFIKLLTPFISASHSNSYGVTVHSLAVFFPLIESVCVCVSVCANCVKRNLGMSYTRSAHTLD